MKPFKLRKKRILLIFCGIFLLLMYHETLLTQIDKVIMPDSSELCKIGSKEICNFYILSIFLIFINFNSLAFLVERLDINKEEKIPDIIEKLSHSNLQNGGKWQPQSNNIRSKNKKLAIVVPYRDRLTNLEIFLKNIHPFLMNQNIEYGIYVVEPIEKLKFNKGISMNVGYIEALKEKDYDCFIFHDVDMVPENPENFYECNPIVPKLIAVSISAFGYS